ncbi:MAG: hypothetical protein U1E06_08100 [Tabrizicola sp.]|uniref:hypothetical protein n=1 Tax=Tabrizicola sp. TaxID=2005166 RepID=UPI0027331CEF|nr:hypothetical protein [Tabrizicola sp.]MDP3262665.1 hypothetical protein [Tabrizicola sp.]MDP3647344.1 hypothetical protein [Paracoccaceae bacterium]MDZ4066805.1 hypothetical protein [Tabrizicola sp.]
MAGHCRKIVAPDTPAQDRKLRNPRISRHFQAFRKNFRVFVFSLLRVLACLRKYRLTEAETPRERLEATGKSEDKADEDTLGSWRLGKFCLTSAL